MYVHFWKSEALCPGGNFGDEINPWLWSKLLPNQVSHDESESLPLLCGIGTLINEDLPQDREVIIFGSGAGYGSVPKLSRNWEVLAVRGPRTADALGLDRSFAVTDSAILVRSVLPRRSGEASSQRRPAFFPHWQTPFATWRRACELSGIDFIDPADPVEKTFETINNAEYVITEAMHGAIVADSLRTPWIPVLTRCSINEFKWLDWCDSMDIRYRPRYFHFRRFTLNQPPIRVAAEHAAAFLLRSCRLEHSMLSQDPVLERNESRMLDKLDYLKRHLSDSP
ncbi:MULTISPECIES: polysaccharide pyruvyl transferase family protein [Rhodopirellula]|uniref:polysaccharide pyruvyl transferase family protein n=1 Tax=Rhodopirellula TaxID=265488 RepID=UPI002579FE15|nr:polysaccharide pyruvyl transferase family protein [Rhodopirellula sp. UBA1907]